MRDCSAAFEPPPQFVRTWSDKCSQAVKKASGMGLTHAESFLEGFTAREALQLVTVGYFGLSAFLVYLTLCSKTDMYSLAVHWSTQILFA